MSSPPEGCMICTVINDRRFRERTEHGIIFEPDNPLAPGHLIAAPLTHIADASVNPTIAAQVMRMVTMRAKPPYSVLAPVGSEAGQRHPHMYVHILPVNVWVEMAPRKEDKDESASPAKPRKSSRPVRRRGDVSRDSESAS